MLISLEPAWNRKLGITSSVNMAIVGLNSTYAENAQQLNVFLLLTTQRIFGKMVKMTKRVSPMISSRFKKAVSTDYCDPMCQTRNWQRIPFVLILSVASGASIATQIRDNVCTKSRNAPLSFSLYLW